MEPISALKTTTTLLAKMARWWAGRNDEAFKKERDELFREWTSELAIAMNAHAARLERVEGEVAANERLEALSGSRAFWRVLDNYGYEAAREAIDERRKMLAWAAAGSVSSKLTIPQMARVERTLRELDPNDVAVLQQLSDLAISIEPGSAALSADTQARATKRHKVWLDTQPSGHILAAAGCVRVQDYNFDFPVVPASAMTFPTVVEVVTVTALGGWILTVASEIK